ncbi:MAG: autotransporter outer membrane beta-barrel domain-containing protein [Proteobacteria bacterium]|nr:autotransporter outer membrane beta-barrel domain-containing protein [Pseudomonadota bacterium]
MKKISYPILFFSSLGLFTVPIQSFAIDVNNFGTLSAAMIAGNFTMVLTDNILFTRNFSTTEESTFAYNYAITGDGFTLDGNNLFAGLSQTTANLVSQPINKSIALDNITMQNFRGLNGAAVNNINYDGESMVQIGYTANFLNNIASGLGGAIYSDSVINGRAIIQISPLGQTVLFDGNYDHNGTIRNDIHMAGDQPELNIIGSANGQVIFNDGIRSEDSTATITKSGPMTMTLGANSVNDGFSGTFTQTGGETDVYTAQFFSGTNNISNGSVIHFFNSSTANVINATGGAVVDLRSAAAGQYNILRVNDWNGGGASLNMNTNGITADRLVINQTANAGNTVMHVTAFNGGAQPTAAGSDGILVVDTTTAAVRDSSFSLYGGVLDTGALEYRLVQATDDQNWYLRTSASAANNSAPVLTNTARTVESVPAVHLAIVNSGMNELRKRLGALRYDNRGDAAGAWIRGYGRNVDVDENIHIGFNLVGTEAGIDILRCLWGGATYLGVMGGVSYAPNIRVRQSNAFDGTGSATVPSVGVYATWLKRKWFVDATARYFWANMEMSNTSSAGDHINYDARRDFVSTSLEGGREFMAYAPKFMQTGRRNISLIAWEPKAEVRYTHAGPSSHTTNFQDTIIYGATDSLIGRAALQASYLTEGTDSIWKPYIELGVYNEWLGTTDVNFAGMQLQSDLGGMGVEGILGANVRMGQHAYAYGDVSYEKGDAFQIFGLQLGVRAKF